MCTFFSIVGGRISIGTTSTLTPLGETLGLHHYGRRTEDVDPAFEYLKLSGVQLRERGSIPFDLFRRTGSLECEHSPVLVNEGE